MAIVRGCLCSWEVEPSWSFEGGDVEALVCFMPSLVAVAFVWSLWWSVIVVH